LDLYVLVSWMIVAGGLADREALTTFWCHGLCHCQKRTGGRNLLENPYLIACADLTVANNVLLSFERNNDSLSLYADTYVNLRTIRR
jgi:hypothetical protein